MLPCPCAAALDILLSVTPAELLTVSMLSQSLFPFTISMRRPQLNFEPRSIVYFSEALGDQHRVLTDRSTVTGVMIWTLFPLSTPNVAYEISNALFTTEGHTRVIFRGGSMTSQSGNTNPEGVVQSFTMYIHHWYIPWFQKPKSEIPCQYCDMMLDLPNSDRWSFYRRLCTVTPTAKGN